MLKDVFSESVTIPETEGTFKVAETFIYFSLFGKFTYFRFL